MLGNWETCDSLVDQLTADSAYPTLVRATMIIFTSWPRGRLEAAKRALADIDGLKDSEDLQLVGAYRQLEGLVLHMEGRPAEAAVALRTAYDVWLSLNPRLNVPAWGMELEALAQSVETVVDLSEFAPPRGA